MRLIFAAAALTILALPAAAQRLDTRVTNVWAAPHGTNCRLSANGNVRLDESRAQAILSQPPIEDDSRYSVALTMTFSPHTGASAVGLEIIPIGTNDRPVSAKLLIDGTDSGVALSLHGDYDHMERGDATVPEADRAQVARRILAARWVELDVIDGDSPKPRRYRFDALRIRDVAEILEIIHYSCAGFRAD